MKQTKLRPYGTSVPTRLIHPNNLPEVERVLSAYLVYLRGGVPASDQRDTSIGADLRARATARVLTRVGSSENPCGSSEKEKGNTHPAEAARRLASS